MTHAYSHLKCDECGWAYPEYIEIVSYDDTTMLFHNVFYREQEPVHRDILEPVHRDILHLVGQNENDISETLYLCSACLTKWADERFL